VWRKAHLRTQKLLNEQKTFNTDVEYRLWYAITTQANAATRKADKKKDVAEGLAETLTMDEAKKVLRQYGADNFKTTSNELHFYKNGRPMSVGLTMDDTGIRHVNLSQLNSATRKLKGQGVSESKASRQPKQLKKSNKR
jgi:hypothetical protein